MHVNIVDSSCHHLISNNVDEGVDDVLQKIIVEEPQALMDMLESVESMDCFDDLDAFGSEDVVYGFEQSDSQILKSLNRLMDLKMSVKHKKAPEIKWNLFLRPSRSISSRKRLSSERSTQSSSFTSDTLQNVPKRRRGRPSKIKN